MSGEVVRILQEVAAGARSWSEVQDILHEHCDTYFAMRPRDRERLNERIKDLMKERMT
jgi:hypothetical protein